jgi:hypothetical protein
MNGTQRAHIVIPADLLREIDEIVGPRGRSAFLLETAREEVRRRKLLRFLESDDAGWQDRDHPELYKGSAAWVRKLRSEGEGRATTPSESRRAQQSKPSQSKPRKSQP